MKYNKRPLAFKVSAIYLAEQRKGSLKETAQDLGVPKSVLGYWLKPRTVSSESIMLPVRTMRKAFTSQKAPSPPSRREPWAGRLMMKI